jgi:hypothetical protein
MDLKQDVLVSSTSHQNHIFKAGFSGNVKMKLSYKLSFHFKEEHSTELHIWSLQTISSQIVMK